MRRERRHAGRSGEVVPLLKVTARSREAVLFPSVATEQSSLWRVPLLHSSLTFRNCTLYNALDVGLVQSNANSEEAEEANAILDAIFNEINDIYMANNANG